jgi:PrcB C-terminal
MRCAASLLMLLASCATGAALTVAVPFSTLDKGLTSGVREPTQLVIRTHDDWAALWGRHMQIQPAPQAPPVDFSRDMVVALFMGERPTGGHRIEITRVERADSGLSVRYRSQAPDPGTMVSQALTQPFHLVTLPRDESPVVFIAETPTPR